MKYTVKLKTISRIMKVSQTLLRWVSIFFAILVGVLTLKGFITEPRGFDVGFANTTNVDVDVVIHVYNEKGDLLQMVNIQPEDMEDMTTSRFWNSYDHPFETLSFTVEAYSRQEGEPHLIDKIFGEWPGEALSCGNDSNHICIEFFLLQDAEDPSKTYLEFGGII